MEDNQLDKIAQAYSIRQPSQRVVQHICEQLQVVRMPTILECGCGTGDYLEQLNRSFRGRAFGFDKSEKMISKALARHNGIDFLVADAEKDLPYGNNTFDFVFNINVVNLIKKLDVFYKNLSRVLKIGRVLLTVCSSEKDVMEHTVAIYFPVVVEIELNRHPAIDVIMSYYEALDFSDIYVTHTEYRFKLTLEDLNLIRAKAYTALLSISDDDFSEGFKLLEQRVKEGTAIGRELYTYVWGIKQD